MNRGVIQKALRETLLLTLLAGGLFMMIAGLFAWIIPTVQRQWAGRIPQLPVAQNMIKMLLGAELPPDMSIGPEMLQSMAWAHPVILVVTWTHALLFCTRLPAGEVDRGTIDILLSWPVSRLRVFLSESIVWVLSGALLFVLAYCGQRVGNRASPVEVRPPIGSIMAILGNLACLYLAVGGMAFLFSVVFCRRAQAIGFAFAILIMTIVLNYLAQFYEPLRGISFLSALSYVRPYVVLHNHAVPWSDMGVLLAAAAITWGAAAIIFCRRSLLTT